MKKSFIMLGVAAMAMLAGCNNGGNNATGEAAGEAAAEETTELPAPAAVEEAAPADIDPYLSKLMSNDSTIKVTASGLGYKVIKEGEGSRPTENNTAMVKYTGKHTDGSQFDSSNGSAVEFPLMGVVPGFREGISLMPVGSVYELYIPGKLGYGERGVPQAGIAPNELLVFEVELVDFK